MPRDEGIFASETTQQQEQAEVFDKTRRACSVVKSAINGLEVHGLGGAGAESDFSTRFSTQGYRGASVDGVTIWRRGQRRGVTPSIRKAIHRRSAIEPAMGHIKNEGKLRRNWLKGSLGDALNAVLCGAGHNLRMILRALRLFYAPFFASGSFR